MQEVIIPEQVYKEVNREGKPEADKIAAWAQYSKFQLVQGDVVLFKH
jgi:hypothetical protein